MPPEPPLSLLCGREVPVAKPVVRATVRLAVSVLTKVELPLTTVVTVTNCSTEV